MNYNYVSHGHCYTEENPPCGFTGKHCCLCDILTAKPQPVSQVCGVMVDLGYPMKFVCHNRKGNCRDHPTEAPEDKEGNGWEREFREHFEHVYFGKDDDGHPQYAPEAVIDEAVTLITTLLAQVAEESRRAELEWVLENAGHDGALMFLDVHDVKQRLATLEALALKKN